MNQMLSIIFIAIDDVLHFNPLLHELLFSINSEMIPFLMTEIPYNPIKHDFLDKREDP